MIYIIINILSFDFINPIIQNEMYGQKSNLRSKVFINTLCTKGILQFHNISTILLPFCRYYSDNSPPPPLFPHRMYRFKYYVLFNDDDKNSPTKSK